MYQCSVHCMVAVSVTGICLERVFIRGSHHLTYLHMAENIVAKNNIYMFTIFIHSYLYFNKNHRNIIQGASRGACRTMDFVSAQRLSLAMLLSCERPLLCAEISISQVCDISGPHWIQILTYHGCKYDRL